METQTTTGTSSKIRLIFEAQKLHLSVVKRSGPGERIAKLLKLKEAILKRDKEICEAMCQDLRKPIFESEAYEVLFTLAEIDFAVRHLKGWMKPQRVSSNLLNRMAKNRIVYEPKGLCLILAPWNYPFQLVLSPLVSAIAAGNCCILKPSELAPATSRVLSDLIRDCFPENEIALIEGDAVVATELLSLPFNHIFFTGSTAIGKKVMEAASKNLASVTLELGGKSPVIIDSGSDLNKAASKIAWGKWINAGQTCIAPDYVFIHEKEAEAFVKLLHAKIEAYYFSQEKLNTTDYGKIITPRHFLRLKNLLEDCIARGGKVGFGGELLEEERTFYPTVVSNVPVDSLLMQEEIFGPILPILTYKDLKEVMSFINARDKPLALYIFSDRKQKVKEILQETSSGGACVNDVMLQISNPHLPFGGVNSSGMGGSHGFHGFRAFSHERGVVYQNRLFDIGHIVYPPYTGKGKILRFLKRLM